MIDHTNATYDENETILSSPIKLGTVCDENQTGQWYDRYTSAVYDGNDIKESGPIG